MPAASAHARALHSCVLTLIRLDRHLRAVNVAPDSLLAGAVQTRLVY